MNLQEYKKTERMTYLEYCDYLQDKHGEAYCDYMTSDWYKNPRVTRTKDGLFAHHKYEDHAIDLSKYEWAIKFPFEWQKAENIIYCDYLEHLYLHILICEYPRSVDPEMEVGIGAIQTHLIPKLNNFYSGWETGEYWEIPCLNKIKYDKEVYLTLLKRFKTKCKNYPLFTEESLYGSAEEEFWDAKNNKELFEEIKKL